jgi:hypothetical protein
MNYFNLPIASFLALSLGMFLGCASPVQAAVDIAISPPYLEFEVAQQSRTKSFNLLNYADKPIKVKVSVYNWMLDENNKVKLLPPSEQSLDQWLMINPLEFTIPARGQQTIRLGVRSKVTPTVGEHRAMIYFDTEPTEASQGSISVRGRLGAAVYGYVGERSRIGVLNGITVSSTRSKTSAVFDISSNGKNNVRMSGQYTIWSADKFPGANATTPIPNLGENKETVIPPGVLEAGLLPSLPVLPNTRRQLSLQFQKLLPPGKYFLDINGQLGESALDRSWPFVVAP